MVKRNSTQSEMEAFFARGGQIRRVEEGVHALNVSTRELYNAFRNGEKVNPKLPEDHSDSVMDMRKNVCKNGVIVTDGAGRKLLVD